MYLSHDILQAIGRRKFILTYPHLMNYWVSGPSRSNIKVIKQMHLDHDILQHNKSHQIDFDMYPHIFNHGEQNVTTMFRIKGQGHILKCAPT